MIITFDDFQKVDIRSGTVTKAETFPEARKPAYKVWVDFGEAIGILKSSAQITHHYNPETLVGMKVCGAVNLGERQIGPFISQFLLLGFEDIEGKVVLITSDKAVPNGKKLG